MLFYPNNKRAAGSLFSYFKAGAVDLMIFSSHAYGGKYTEASNFFYTESTNAAMAGFLPIINISEHSRYTRLNSNDESFYTHMVKSDSDFPLFQSGDSILSENELTIATDFYYSMAEKAPSIPAITPLSFSISGEYFLDPLSFTSESGGFGQQCYLKS